MSGVLISNSAQGVYPVPPTAIPATITASGTYVTGILPAAGFKALAAACTLSQAGTIVIQRYIDAAGTIPIGAAISATLVGGTSNYAEVHDGVAAAAWQVTVTNTGGATGNLTNFALLATV